MTQPVLLLSTADTELLAARGSGALYRTANPARVDPDGLPPLLDGVAVVVLRLLGGRRAWPEGVDALAASGLPVVLLGGEAAPDAELMAASTVPAGVASEALAYLAAGGTANLRELHRFLSDTVLLTGEGFEPPAAMPDFGVHGTRAQDPAKPTVGVVFYRAHELSGNSAFVDVLCDAIEARGANALPVFCGSLRGAQPELMELLGQADALVATVLAAGGTVRRGRERGRRGGLLGRGRARHPRRPGAAGLVPDDLARHVGRVRRRPLADGRRHAGGDPGVRRPADHGAVLVQGDRAGRRHPRLPRRPRARRPPGRARGAARPPARHPGGRAEAGGGALVSYPTKHSRVGNAVGLDTPASAVVLLRALREAGYAVGDFPEDSDELIHTLIAAGGHDVEWLTEEQLLGGAGPRPPGRLSALVRGPARPPSRTGCGSTGGSRRGACTSTGTTIVLASLQFGNVVLMIQPPRGFGENPVAIYHDPDLPPSHHYLAAYRWLEQEFGADAVIHLGKHGTLEWLPGKGLGLAAE